VVRRETFGLTTASGATVFAEPDVAGGAEPEVLTADVDGQGAVVVLVSGSRDVQLFTFLDCQLQPVMNRDNEQYRFDRTGENGDGVACADVDGDGAPELLGLKLSTAAGTLTDGDSVTVTRTVVELDGSRATNGESDTVELTLPADENALEAATTVTCGDLAISTDGISRTA